MLYGPLLDVSAFAHTRRGAQPMTAGEDVWFRHKTQDAHFPSSYYGRAVSPDGA
jgi:hypothetical protein